MNLIHPGKTRCHWHFTRLSDLGDFINTLITWMIPYGGPKEALWTNASLWKRFGRDYSWSHPIVRGCHRLLELLLVGYGAYAKWSSGSHPKESPSIVPGSARGWISQYHEIQCANGDIFMDEYVSKIMMMLGFERTRTFGFDNFKLDTIRVQTLCKTLIGKIRRCW